MIHCGDTGQGGGADRQRAVLPQAQATGVMLWVLCSQGSALALCMRQVTRE